MKSCHVIAEIGTSHQGDLKRAEELIHGAAEAGADSAKFQIVLAREIIHPLTGTVPLPGGDIPLFDHFKKLECSEDFYGRLKEICQKWHIDFMATPFGAESARWLKRLKPGYVKIASPELNHLPLLKQLADFGRPLILSTGVSRLCDIEQALAVLGELPVTLLHCITSYPAPEEEYNLSLLPLYRDLFGCPVGVSDHSTDPYRVPLTSVYQGAVMLEKHICLKRNNDGLDDPFALEPEEFKSMVQHIRQMEPLNQGERKEFLIQRWGQEGLNTLLGSGQKTLAPSEAANYGRTNRSVHALETLAAGTLLTEENTALLRTEKILRPGLAPRFYPDILGRRLTREVQSGQGIIWDDLLSL